MGMSLEDIDLIFRESPSVLSIVKYARTKPHREISDHVLEEKQKSTSP